MNTYARIGKWTLNEEAANNGAKALSQAKANGCENCAIDCCFNVC